MGVEKDFLKNMMKVQNSKERFFDKNLIYAEYKKNIISVNLNLVIETQGA